MDTRSMRGVQRPERYNKEGTIPDISRFLGIVTDMFFDGRNLPHFHV